MNWFRDSLMRINAVLIKEFVQMRRDRMTFGMILGIPIVQLLLFGYAINMDPHHLPTALIAEEQTPVVRSIVTALENSKYYKIKIRSDDPRETEDLLQTGKAAFVIIIPTGFTERLFRGDRPQILIEADATDPSVASNALARAPEIINTALRQSLTGPLADLLPGQAPYDLVVHPRYNPEAITQYNIVPGLLGILLTMTLVMITAMAMTREVERGNMENLLALPVAPAEMMVGKIVPYVAMGIIQASIVLLAAYFLFRVPFVGDPLVLASGVAIFIIANLAIGFTFSTVAVSQIQAMQLTFFYFMPNILLSGFMFPFAGMPNWAQAIGEVLPVTHLLRIVRGVMLKDADFIDLKVEFAAMIAFTACAVIVALARYRRTLD